MTHPFQNELEQWRKDADALSYEEALSALDLLLAELQNDAVPMADLQRHYLQGEVYLQRCETLLSTVEHTVIQLNPDTLQPTDTTDDA